MTTALLVHQPIRADETDRIVAGVTTRLRGSKADGLDALTTDPAVVTASVFVRRPTAGPDELVWYLEVESDAVSDPADLVGRSALMADDIDDALGAPADWVTLGDRNGALAVHATLDGRPDAIATTTGTAQLVVPGAEPEPATDVVLLGLRLRPGLPTRLVRGAVRLIRALDRVAWVQSLVESWTQPVLEAERMFTETIFLTRGPDGSEFRWYMEVEEFAAAVDAYADRPNRLAWLSEALLSWAFDAPGLLRERQPTSEYELLVHGVSPARV